MRKQMRVWLCCLTFVVAVSFYTVSAYASSTASAQDPSGTGGNTNGLTASEVQKILDEQAKGSSSVASSKPSSSPSSQNASSSKRAFSSRNSQSGVSSGDSSGETSGELSSGTEASQETSGEISLPSVGSVPEDNPLSSVIVNPQENQQTKLIGIISWVCIVLGVIVVLAVVFSNRRPPRGGSGRKRYHRPNQSKKKHLLNDKYYRHMRY